jgi:hypothetical protein
MVERACFLHPDERRPPWVVEDLDPTQRHLDWLAERVLHLSSDALEVCH